MAVIGSPTTRDHFTLLLDRGLRNVFFQMYELRNTAYEMIYKVQDSEKKTETDVIMAGLGTLFQKTEGDSPAFDSGQQAYSKTYTHTTWALGIEITEEAMEDELYGFLKAMARELGIAAGYTRSVQALDLLNSLSDTVYTAEGTNYTLLSTSHYLVTGGTWSNRPTVATDIGQEALETALAAWQTNMVDQRGRKVDIQPKYLTHGVSDQSVVYRLLTSMNRPFGNDNDINWIRTQWQLEPLTLRHMTDDTRWFLIADPNETTMRYNNRRPTRMRQGTDDRSGNMLEIVSYRESHGTASPVGIYGSP